MDITQIQLQKLSPEIFGDIAKNCADKIGQNDRKNNSTQIRKYYDELVMWHEKVMLNGDYENNAPFIKMMKAKVAYAKGRDLVTQDFVDMFNAIINQINSAETLKNAKLFFEAVLGFRKALEKGK
ncbi:MAG: type III-A CRISPR-associated protein Csm2 [Neisseriaceae bacterium]|nr:type III-A CRISPR-associated protein Csm2 [Neisseriaceae bacterium]MBR5675193.1 type III-A CRISPR-associated protein Csm2 [Neisseriaceae bacterium]